MKKYIKLLLSALCAFAIVTSTYAATNTNTVASAKAPVVQKTADGGLFNAGELGLSLGSSYDVGQASTLKSGKTLFSQPYNLNFNAGAFYFPWRNLGFEANVPFYNTKGVSVDEVQAGLLLRLPLAKNAAIFKNLAPYVGLSGVYNWQDVQDWAYIAKGGLEVRLNKHWGVFGEADYRNCNFQWEKGEVTVSGGLKLVF